VQSVYHVVVSPSYMIVEHAQQDHCHHRYSLYIALLLISMLPYTTSGFSCILRGTRRLAPRPSTSREQTCSPPEQSAGSYYLTLLIAQVEESRFAERRSALRVSLCTSTQTPAVKVRIVISVRKVVGHSDFIE
jgi:hypothetical protein